MLIAPITQEGARWTANSRKRPFHYTWLGWRTVVIQRQNMMMPKSLSTATRMHGSALMAWNALWNLCGPEVASTRRSRTRRFAPLACYHWHAPVADGMHFSTIFFNLNLFYGMVPIVVLLVVQVYNCLHVLGVSGENKCPNNIPSGHGHRPTAWYGGLSFMQRYHSGA